MDQAPMMGQTCKCPHHMMVPFFIVLIGAIFLMRTLGYLSMRSADIVWPIVLMCIGFQKMARGMCKCCKNH